MKIALLQCRSPSNPDHATQHVLELLNHLPKYTNGIVLPEIVNMVARSFEAATTSENDPLVKALQEFAKKNSIWVIIGSVVVRENAAIDSNPNSNKKIYPQFRNRSLYINEKGEIKASYDKLHMFDVDLKESEYQENYNDKKIYRESSAFQAGKEAVLLVGEHCNIGLTICYDLRQPGLYRDLALKGADIITVPAAFTYVTGKQHWHTLLRARAIENGVFIVAPAQGGVHQDSRRTFGHSLVIDPFGNTLAEAKDDAPQIISATIDLEKVKRARASIPALKAQRKYLFTRVNV